MFTMSLLEYLISNVYGLWNIKHSTINLFQVRIVITR